MKPRTLQLAMIAFSLSTALFGQSLASAGDLPVVYNVQDKPLKLAVTGTVLTFELFSDSACTVPFFTQAIAIDDVDVISKLKRFAPKGGVKPPRTDTIQAVLTGVPAMEGPYLEVTGVGITAAGGSCQLQTSGLEGPSGVVSIVDFHGAIGDLAGDAPNLTFAGPTATVTTTVGQRITGSAVAPMGKSTLGENNVVLALCYKSISGGSITPFIPNLAVIEISPGGARHLYSATGSVVMGAGTWAVGFCAQNQGGSALNDNGNVNGWVMVTN